MKSDTKFSCASTALRMTVQRRSSKPGLIRTLFPYLYDAMRKFVAVYAQRLAPLKTDGPHCFSELFLTQSHVGNLASIEVSITTFWAMTRNHQKRRRRSLWRDLAQSVPNHQWLVTLYCLPILLLPLGSFATSKGSFVFDLTHAVILLFLIFAVCPCWASMAFLNWWACLCWRDGWVGAGLGVVISLINFIYLQVPWS
jgi:hypothetical protein